MSFNPGSLIVQIGEAAWRAVAPWKRLKIARNKRRARLGKPLLPITKDDDMVFPKGSLTKTGIVVAFAGPLIGAGLHALGIGDCAPVADAAADAAQCVGADQIQSTIVEIVSKSMEVGGAVIAWVGRNRAAKHAAEALAAAKQSV